MRSIASAPAAVIAAVSLFALVAASRAEEAVPDVAALEQELREREIAFSRSAEERDIEAFRSFLTPQSVFSGGPSTLRGPEAIAAAWAGFFAPEGPAIRWRPERVTVVEDGDLGLSTGPYWIESRNEDGEPVAVTGTFFSVWRRIDGVWKVVLDSGTQAVPVEAPAE